MLKKALIRVDISSNVGTGHFRRMKNLAEVMKESVRFRFVVKTDDKANNVFFGSDIIFIDKSDEIFTVLNIEQGIDFIIFDQLEYSEELFATVKEQYRDIVLIAFHENTKFSDRVDLSINYNTFHGFQSFSDSGHLLCGPRYMIFNGEISKYKNGAKAKDGIFVSFGGSDPCDFTGKLIEFVLSRKFENNFHIFVGPMYEKELKSFESNNIFVHKYPEDFFSLMSSFSKCIVSGGNTMYESLYLGVPVCILAQNTHQAEFAMTLAKEYDQYFAGVGDEINWSTVEEFIKSDELNIPVNVFDLEGAKRISDKILGLVS